MTKCKPKPPDMTFFPKLATEKLSKYYPNCGSENCNYYFSAYVVNIKTHDKSTVVGIQHMLNLLSVVI